MSPSVRLPLRLAIAVSIGALLVSGCSSSSDSPAFAEPDRVGEDTADPIGSGDVVDADGGGPGGATNGTAVESTDDIVGTSDESDGSSELDDDAPDDTADGTSVGTPDGTGTEPSATDPDPIVRTSTRVDFEITVPAYVSNSLQVRLSHGDDSVSGTWNGDESWTVSDDFPVDTDVSPTIAFLDRNGDVTLGTVEDRFRTGRDASSSREIAADRFDTERWDDDGDGESNLAESRAGRDPLGDDAVEAVRARLELVADKTFRLVWSPAAGARTYRVLENPDGVSGFVPISGELDASTRTFDHRVALYSRTNARYVVEACNDSGCTSSDELSVSGTLVQAIGRVGAEQPGEGDNFGWAISVSDDGGTLAVGAPAEDSAATRTDRDGDDDSAPEAGAVYVFVRRDGAWRQEAYIKASNTGREDTFGAAVGLSGDGTTLAVGARGEDSAATGVDGNQNDESAEDAGAVYVFTRDGGSWRQQAYLKASNAGTRDAFGESLTLSADGDTLAVGAYVEDGGATGVNGDQANVTGGFASGAVYVFVREDGVWRQQAYVKPSNTRSVSFFGESAVSLSADGNTLAVGANGESGARANADGVFVGGFRDRAGAAYVFARRDGSWRQQAYLIASNTGDRDRFGSSIDLSADGRTLAIGAVGERSASAGVDGDQDDESALLAGAVYVFVRGSDGWSQQAYVKASYIDPDERNLFGNDVALSADGNILAAGAYVENGAAIGIDGDQTDLSATQAGAVYVLVRDGDDWRHQAYLKTGSDESGLVFFGRALDLSSDGGTLAVGAPSEGNTAGDLDGDPTGDPVPRSGAVYLY